MSCGRPVFKKITTILGIITAFIGIISFVLNIPDAAFLKEAKNRTNIQIVVDRSKGMESPFDGRTKWDAAIEAIDATLSIISDEDNLSLRKFGGPCKQNNTELAVNFDTKNIRRVRKKLRQMTLGGETTLVNAVVHATGNFNNLELFGGDVTNKIIIISSGADSCITDSSERIRERLQEFSSTSGLMRVNFRFIGMGVKDDERLSYAKMVNAVGGKVDFPQTFHELKDAIKNSLSSSDVRQDLSRNLVRKPGADNGVTDSDVLSGHGSQEEDDEALIKPPNVEVPKESAVEEKVPEKPAADEEIPEEPPVDRNIPKKPPVKQYLTFCLPFNETRPLM